MKIEKIENLNKEELANFTGGSYKSGHAIGEAVGNAATYIGAALALGLAAGL